MALGFLLVFLVLALAVAECELGVLDITWVRTLCGRMEKGKVVRHLSKYTQLK